MNPEHPEMKSKLSAIKNLISMLDDKILEDHNSMRSGEAKSGLAIDVGIEKHKTPGGETVIEEEIPRVDSSDVMAEQAEESMMNPEPENMDMAEGDVHQEAPLDMNHVVHDMNKAEDDPGFDIDNPDIAQMLEGQMENAHEEDMKYRPRVRSEEKGNLYVTKKSSGTSSPMPEQTLRKTNYSRKKGM